MRFHHITISEMMFQKLKCLSFSLLVVPFLFTQVWHIRPSILARPQMPLKLALTIIGTSAKASAFAYGA